MHHNHKPWKPLPATKPQHLTTHDPSNGAGSLAALQGATSAFASKPKTTIPHVNQLRKQFEAQSQTEDGRGRHVSQLQTPGQAHEVPRSPSRGRHLNPQQATLAGAQSAVSRPKPPTKPGLERNPSLIAARLVSVSASPVRPTASPSPQHEMLSFLSRDTLKRMNSAPGDARLADKDSDIDAVVKRLDTIQKAQSQLLNFDDLPELSPSKVEASTGEVRLPLDGQPLSKSQNLKATAHIPIPVRGSFLQAQRTADAALPNSAASDHHSSKGKPIVPPPRKGRPLARSPLQADHNGRKQIPGVTREQAINRMADAMVASSLASTRNSSPAKDAGQPRLRRAVSAHSLFKAPAPEPVKLPIHHRQQKPMKQTLRKTSADDDDETEITKRGRRHLVRKHPNMHHEGDRKRWRDKVTDLERKRYEGVFAANRGLLLKSADPRSSPSRLVDPTSESNLVVNIVVRDIWERSRLSTHILEQIYDLVAPEEPLALNREQFVVGLWLIDQKLKGRKLPVRVTDSVWASVRHSQGIKIGNNARP